MAYIFQSIAQKGSAQGIQPNASAQARDWYRSQAQSITNVNRNKLMTDKDNQIGTISQNSIGKMYMFFYDPKLKDVLPYYDKFPLVFPIELYSDGFLGLNLHYLPPVLRAKLMDTLYSTVSNDKYDDTTKLQISYSLLNGAARFSYFKPCVKRYLSSHVVGNFLNVKPEYWDTALMLPTERFVGASTGTVWGSSKGR